MMCDLRLSVVYLSKNSLTIYVIVFRCLCLLVISKYYRTTQLKTIWKLLYLHLENDFSILSALKWQILGSNRISFKGWKSTSIELFKRQNIKNYIFCQWMFLHDMALHTFCKNSHETSAPVCYSSKYEGSVWYQSYTFCTYTTEILYLYYADCSIFL